MFTKRISLSKSDLNCDLGQVFDDFPGIINAKTLLLFFFLLCFTKAEVCVGAGTAAPRELHLTHSWSPLLQPGCRSAACVHKHR